MIYFIQDSMTNEIKIGSSDDPMARLKGLQTGNPHVLGILGIIPGGMEGEADLRRRFKPYLVREKSEWFSPQIIDEVRAIVFQNGTRQTVESECESRGRCRGGINGILVVVDGHGELIVKESKWAAKKKLMVNVHPIDNDRNPFWVFASDCIMASLWPVVCCQPNYWEQP